MPHDVNGDGIVDVEDLLLVAWRAIEAAAGAAVAPYSTSLKHLEILTAEEVRPVAHRKHREIGKSHRSLAHSARDPDT